MLNDKRTLGLVAAFVLLVGIAVAGWVRRPITQNDNSAPAVIDNANAGTPAPSTYAVNRSYPSDPGYVQQNRSRGVDNQEYANQYAGSYQQDGYYSTMRRPVYVRRYAPPQEVAVQNEPVEREYADNGRNRVYRTEIHHGRSVKKSVAIVAGTAGAGAAIGAVAGGGKGAAIGALSGGGAGFIYDRLTHNH